MSAVPSPVLTRVVLSSEHTLTVRPREATRLPGLDAARVIATLGVVWFHTATSPELKTSGVLGRFSVAFYTMAAMVFLIDSCRRRERSFAAYARDRFRRLYLPFLGWAAITLLIENLLHTFNPDFFAPTLNWNFLIDGQTLHLWYVPFLLVASLLIYPLAKWMLQSTPRQYAVAALCVALAIALDCELFNWLPTIRLPLVGYFFEQSAMRWSAVYWGVAVAIVWRNGLSTSRWRIPLAILGSAALLAAAIWMWNEGVTAALKVYGGMGLLLLALAPWKNKFVTALAPYGRMSSGIYFAHMAAIYLASEFLHSIEGADLGRCGDVMIYLMAVTLSFIAIRLMSLTPRLAWLAGIDNSRKTNPTRQPLFTALEN